ncbi:hypothetical protein ACJMK2_013299 [Sinanodonta woodiana]|uniref:Uncharacterized protein n=1 Tax=Sinanodonta woodiana TaxID=1069815 RepID=A0ABD3UX25_SINWO
MIVAYVCFEIIGDVVCDPTGDNDGTPGERLRLSDGDLDLPIAPNTFSDGTDRLLDSREMEFKAAVAPFAMGLDEMLTNFLSNDLLTLFWFASCFVCFFGVWIRLSFSLESDIRLLDGVRIGVQNL